MLHLVHWQVLLLSLSPKLSIGDSDDSMRIHVDLCIGTVCPILYFLLSQYCKFSARSARFTFKIALNIGLNYMYKNGKSLQSYQ